jgi:hypothetical protein
MWNRVWSRFRRFRMIRASDVPTRVRHALALHRRGEARTDGLELRGIRTTMHLEWRARDVHPWDRNINRARREQLFTQQCLEDTADAIVRLFSEIPELGSLEIRVFRELADAPLLTGVIIRSKLEFPRRAAPAMWLKTHGVKFHMSGWRLEPLAAADHEGVRVSGAA